jgi:hypothetical protein
MLIDPTSPEPLANRARFKRDGQIHEAHEIFRLGYQDTDQWVCIDRQCAVPMTPCAWLPEKKDGSKYLRTPILQPTPITIIKPQCTGTESQHGGSGGKGTGDAALPTKRADPCPPDDSL